MTTKPTPREPTPEMVEAGMRSDENHRPDYTVIYRAMWDAAPVQSVKVPRWRHVKRGTVYAEIGCAELQGSATEGDLLVVYLGDDGNLWARSYTEFHDGRFVPASPTKVGGTP